MLDSDDPGLASRSLERHVLGGVRYALLRVDRRLRPEDVQLDTSLIDDLGLDSIKLVGLSVALEDAFDISDFPMQDWSDEEAQRTGGRFTVASLVTACLRCVQARGGT
jgi:acyl carrier protein